jgi:hypothetical protein
MKNKEQVGTWKINVLLYEREDIFYSVHEDDSLNLLIYGCAVEPLDFTDVWCPDEYYFTTKLPGTIIAATE